MKKECLASRSLPDYATFIQTLDDCLQSLETKYKGRMATLVGNALSDVERPV